jgi:hypothetical protein
MAKKVTERLQLAFLNVEHNTACAVRLYQGWPACWYDMIWYDIVVYCNWVDTRWQQYSTQNKTMKQNTQNGTYTTIKIPKYNTKKIRKQNNKNT